jgi:hypothetical protein
MNLPGLLSGTAHSRSGRQSVQLLGSACLLVWFISFLSKHHATYKGFTQQRQNLYSEPGFIFDGVQHRNLFFQSLHSFGVKQLDEAFSCFSDSPR